jgi:hypothetical protein
VGAEPVAVLGNAIGYQAVWFAAVLGAAHDSPWPALAASLVFATWQLAPSPLRGVDARLAVTAVVIGMLLDGAFAATGMLRYSAAVPALPPGGAPLWILCLWLAFALTLNHSLRYLRHQLTLAALLGACGGPLAYLAAARLGAVSFASPRAPVFACLALGWSVAVMVLCYLAVCWETAAQRRPAAAGGEPS